MFDYTCENYIYLNDIFLITHQKVVFVLCPEIYLITHEKLIFDLNIFYCQIYTMGLNTSFTIYIKLYIQYHTYIGLTESMTDNKCISIYDIEKLNNNR